jgi:hypothetical protein
MIRVTKHRTTMKRWRGHPCILLVSIFRWKIYFEAEVCWTACQKYINYLFHLFNTNSSLYLLPFYIIYRYSKFQRVCVMIRYYIYKMANFYVFTPECIEYVIIPWPELLTFINNTVSGVSWWKFFIMKVKSLLFLLNFLILRPRFRYSLTLNLKMLHCNET